MSNTCRISEITHISALIPPDFRDMGQRISELYAWADKNITQCHGCDKLSKIIITDNGEDFLLPCPVFSENCKFGIKRKMEAQNQAVESLRGIIPHNLTLDLKNPKHTFALMQAQSWNFKGILYLYGSTGTGKSFAAAWTLYNYKLRQFLKNLRSPYLWNTGNDSVSWLSAYRAVSDKAYINTACYVPILILDDLGEETNTPSNKATISEIINERYNSKNITIITSNIDINGIAGRYSKRVEERLTQNSTLVQCLGESLRVAPF